MADCVGSGGGQPACPRLVVNGADYADCNGEYELSGEKVDWAPQRFVYKHVAKDRCDPIGTSKGQVAWDCLRYFYSII